MYKTSILAAAAVAVALTVSSGAQARMMGGGGHGGGFGHMGGGSHGGGIIHSGGGMHSVGRSWGGSHVQGHWGGGYMHVGEGGHFASHRGMFVGRHGFHGHHRFFGRGFGAGIVAYGYPGYANYNDYANYTDDESYPEMISVSSSGAAAYSAAYSVPGVRYIYGRGSGCCCD